MEKDKSLNSLRKAIRKMINEDFDMLQGNNTENKIELSFLKVDKDTGNFLYKGTDGDIYASIDGNIHDITNEGEPIGPVYNTIVKKGEPVYNPEDRFGRNPGSKLQTETKDIFAMYKKAGMEAPHPGKGIHTKKFHKCVTSVGDDKGKNPYAICMSKLGKEKAVKSPHRTDEKTAPDSINEMAKPIVPISEKTKTTLNRWIEEKGTKKAAVDLLDKLSQTGMISSFPDSVEYGETVIKVEMLLSKGDFDKAYHTAKHLANKLEKRANKEFEF